MFADFTASTKRKKKARLKLPRHYGRKLWRLLYLANIGSNSFIFHQKMMLHTAHIMISYLKTKYFFTQSKKLSNSIKFSKVWIKVVNKSNITHLFSVWHYTRAWWTEGCNGLGKERANLAVAHCCLHSIACPAHFYLVRLLAPPGSSCIASILKRSIYLE